MAYTKYRSDWKSVTEGPPYTPVDAVAFEQWEEAIFSLKTRWFNVKDYGAVGNGVANDTAAINAAAAAASGKNIFFPAGNYVYNGTGLDYGNIIVQGEGRALTTITLGAGANFINVTTTLSNLAVKGIHFEGGQHVIRSSFTGVNVTRYLLVSDCEFWNYTGAAISDEASDMPWWKIERCQFYGAALGNTFGICHSGLSDSVMIDNCSFLRNRVHIKFKGGGVDAYIDNCDFLRYESYSTFPRVDIWCVPQASAAVAGTGLTVRSSKFGNEALDVNDFRILYADEGSGADNVSKFPNVGADSTGFIVGHSVESCTHFGNGATGTTPPLVYSTTPRLLGCRYGPLVIGATMPSDIVHIRTVPASHGFSRFTTDNIIGPLHGYSIGTEGNSGPRPSNAPSLFRVIDPNGLLATRAEIVPAYTAGDPTGFVNLMTTLVNAFTTSNSTKAGITDSFNGTDAVELTFTTTGGLLFVSPTTPTVGRPAWIEFDVKQGAASPLALVRVDIRDSSAPQNQHFAKIVDASTTYWVRYRFPVVIDAASGAFLVVFSVPSGLAVGQVKIGRVRFYHAREPVIPPAAAIADTSGATLAALETTVNAMKAAMRAKGTILP